MHGVQEGANPDAANGSAPFMRSPVRAALYSALLPGGGQLYNRQLEKAVLLWLWTVMVWGAGLALLLFGLLGHWVPRAAPRPPLGDWIADHAAVVALAWFAAFLLLWAVSLGDAWASARGINAGRIPIRYSMRRQMVHVLAAQLLGFIPLVGLFFPAGVVAEAIDSVRERRGPDRRVLLQEGAQSLAEWAVTRLAFYALWIVLAGWVLWWILRALGVGI